VHTVFLFAVPEMEAKTYLNLIASIARLSQNAELVEKLRLAQTAGAMFQILEQVPLRQPRPASAATLPACLEAR
jgi:mannitol/fructose-specific phosphotransferase system IIA component (Ntr-type)